MYKQLFFQAVHTRYEAMHAFSLHSLLSVTKSRLESFVCAPLAPHALVHWLSVLAAPFASLPPEAFYSDIQSNNNNGVGGGSRETEEVRESGNDLSHILPHFLVSGQNHLKQAGKLLGCLKIIDSENLKSFLCECQHSYVHIEWSFRDIDTPNV